MNTIEATQYLCKILSKESDRGAISNWMEDEFGVSLWSIADMKPELLEKVINEAEVREGDRK